MKSYRSVSALLATSLLAATAFAAAPTSATAATSDSIRPVPLEIVHPTGLPSRFKDATVELTFTIDETGNVRDIAPAGYMADDLAKKLIPVVAQWRFTPMIVDGRPVPVRVIFPLTLAEQS